MNDSARAFRSANSAIPEEGLTIEPLSFSSGVPSRYRVLGLPEGETAEIAYRVIRLIEVWKIKRNKGRLGGVYANAEQALGVLQRRIEAGH
jgi:hypothetical protein